MTTDLATISKTPDLVSSPELNKRLVRLARRSFNEIEALTGIPAAEVAERLGTLFDTRVWRDDLQEEQLLLMEYGDLLEDVKDRLDKAKSEEGYASIARVVMTGFKDLMTRLEKRRAANVEDMERVNQAQAKMMADAIALAMKMATKELKSRYDMIEMDEVNGVFMEALPLAVERIEQSTAS